MEDCDILVVTTTVATRAQAEALGREVIARHLAACVQLDFDVVSIYRWDGKDCTEPEVRLTFKTAPEAEPALRALLAARHPYDLPQYACWRAAATPDYARWVRGQIVPPAP